MDPVDAQHSLIFSIIDTLEKFGADHPLSQEQLDALAETKVLIFTVTSMLTGQTLARILRHTPRLEKLEITNCPRLSPLPDDFQPNCPQSINLVLYDTNITTQDLGILLSKLKIHSLTLASCNNLLGIPATVPNLATLKNLYLAAIELEFAAFLVANAPAGCEIYLEDMPELTVASSKIWPMVILIDKIPEIRAGLTEDINKSIYKALSATACIKTIANKLPVDPFASYLIDLESLQQSNSLYANFLQSYQSLVESLQANMHKPFTVSFATIMASLNQNNQLIDILLHHGWSLNKETTFKAYTQTCMTGQKTLLFSQESRAKIYACAEKLNLTGLADKSANAEEFMGQVFSNLVPRV